MRQTIDDWFTVVDARGRFTSAIGLLLAFGVSLLEIMGAGIVAVSIQLATHVASEPVELPVIGDVEALLPGSTRSSDLRWMVLVGTAFFAVRGLAVVLQQYVIFRATFSLAVRLTDRVAEQLLRRNYAWHLSQNSAELSSLSIIVSQTFAVRLFSPIQTAGSQALTVISLAAVAVAVEPIGAMGAVLAIGGVVAVTLWATRRHLVPLGEIELTEMAIGQQLTSETFQAIREVKLLDLSASVRSRIWQSRRRWARALRRSATITAAPRPIIEAVAFSSLIALVAFRGQADADTALAGVGVLGYAVIRILPTANNLVTHINTVRSAQASMRRLAEILRLENDTQPQTDNVAETDTARLPIEAIGIEFSYPTGDTVLSGVDLRIEPGASLGIAGTTGCGKSTLLDVLAGLLAPTSGEVRLNGIPLEECRADWWRTIGFVPQNITLLDAPLVENIALGVDAAQIDETSFLRAVRLAQLEKVIAGLPEGANTVIGERGVRLSGGQRQRLAIARALYLDPPVIFLDEGTSALDINTEEAVVAGLKSDRPDRTLVMVAHRISTLRGCDEILLLDAGQIVARGTHQYLLDTNQQFRTLAAADAK